MAITNTASSTSSTTKMIEKPVKNNNTAASNRPSPADSAGVYWYHIDGIVCYACVNIIESAVRAIPGIISANISYIGESLRIEAEPDTDLDSVTAELERRGYRSAQISEKEAGKADYNDMSKMRARILVSFFFSVLLVSGYFFDINTWVLFAAASVIQIIAGRQFYIDAFYAVSSRSANMSVLVSIGTLSAYVFSTVSVIRGSGEVFFESAGSVLVLVLIGKYLERSAKISSSESVRKLMESGASEANILTDEGEVKKSADSICKGDRFIVRRGDFIPADGIITSGRCTVDESGLTGESRPVSKEQGDRVYGSTINTDGKIEAAADSDYQDNIYSKMLRALLNSVNGEKAKIQRLADRVSAKFIPAVLITSLFTLFLWYGFIDPGNIARALTNSVAVLIVACPCAMGIAAPLAVNMTVGALGKSGIFVKNPAALEALARVDTVVFDKTGTLTLGPEDRLRQGAPKTVEALIKMGIRVVMLSGDTAERAETAAAGAGINEYRSGLLPEDKVNIITGLQNDAHTVVMVGDGVNDALSISSAEVGIVIGRAAEVSLASSDVVITQNRITHVLKALYAGHVMLENIRRSLFWALIYNILGLILAVCGIITPVIAGTAMSLSSFSVVMNAKALEKKFEKLTFDKIIGIKKENKKINI